MGCFEPCLRILRLAPYLVALTFPLASMAQPVAASSATGARHRFQCAALPDFAARQSTYEQAVQALPRGLFRPRIAGRSPSSAPAGVVIAQSTEPLDGKHCWASFVLSDGSLVRVPPLRGLTRDAAAERLQAAGRRRAAREQPSDGAAAGRVVEQRPEVDAELARGSAVQVAIAAATTIGVPDVVGRSLGDAQTALRSFVVHEVSVASERAEGEVLEQAPPAGTRAAARSRVTLSVSDGSIVTVPPLRGATLADARAALQRAGDLQAATPTGDEPGTMLVDTASPSAGIRVRRGSTVSLTLVPLTPWRAWAAGITTLLVLGGAGLYKWRKGKPSSPLPPGPDFHFSPGIEFNVRPIEARAGGPVVPEVGLRAELVVGRPWARQKEEST